MAMVHAAAGGTAFWVLSCIWQVNYMVLVGPFQLTYSVLKDPDCAEHFQHNSPYYTSFLFIYLFLPKLRFSGALKAGQT